MINEYKTLSYTKICCDKESKCDCKFLYLRCHIRDRFKLSRIHFSLLEDLSHFPKPFKIGKVSKWWKEDEIYDWFNSRANAKYWL